MLSDNRIDQIERDARTAALALGDRELRTQAMRAEERPATLPAGDDRDAVAVVVRIYTLELGRRELLSKRF